MKKLIKSLLKSTAIFLFAGLLGTSSASAAPKFSVAAGNWNNTATWSDTSGGAPGAAVPVAGDAVTLASGFNVAVTADAACDSVTFGATAATSTTLSLDPGITLAVSGVITIPRPGSTGNNIVAVGAGILNAGSIAFTSTGAAKGTY